MIDLLTSILSDVQSRVQVTSTAPDPLAGEAARAVTLFKEIESAIALKARPTVTLTALPNPTGGSDPTLTWTSTGADAVLIVGVDADGKSTTVPNVPPATSGSVTVKMLLTTVFTATATATGRCKAFASVTVTVGDTDILLKSRS